LAGSGPLESYYKKITKDIPEINYLGWLSKEKIDFYMQNSLAVVVPSRVASNGDCEGLPTIILEALSNSCLVIASNHSGIPEIIKPNITGFMFRENDHNELANLIIKAKGITVEDRKNMIDEGQRVLKEKFNSYDQSIKFEKSLSQIVASYGSGGGI
jgi:colanic acid/amylovoran biosynthesis glycosyltransferase